MLKRCLSGLTSFLFCVSVYAADGTVVQTVEQIGTPVKHIFTWTANPGTNYVSGAGTLYVRGELLRVTFVPSSTLVPTGAYTVTLKDQNGIDVLAGMGSSLSTGTVTSIRPGIASLSVGTTTNIVPFAINDILTLALTNCGVNASGKIELYVR